ncbi:protein kinase superfamily protein [Tasmannia lanceolata]|uniref:protein kinase superfamily protein n=1 Tax=Tasmannia lanceolata TaxID=3420 RepID=UPI0040636DA2
MCKKKKSTDAIDPKPSSRNIRTARSSAHTDISSASRSGTNPSYPSATPPGTGTGTDFSNKTSSSKASTSSSHVSLASLQDSLPENPHIYSFSEIRSATNNFLSKKISSSSSAWHCSIRGKDVAIIQRKLRHSSNASDHVRHRLSLICKSHHSTVIKLLGASLSSSDYIYLVYEFIPGANLANCLRNPKNPNFTVISTWISRMQIAADLAHGLEYIHHYTGIDLQIVHNHIKSSSIIITDPSLNAKICNFGAAELTGEFAGEEIAEVEGTRGYMAPEFLAAGIVSQKSDVFAFGVVILELLSGEEPVRYRLDQTKNDYKKISLIETAKDAIESGLIRRWIDRRLKDSFPEDVAEKVTRVALDCVHVEPDKRPDMRRAAGKISKLFLESKAWSEKMKIPTEFTVSMAPR